MGEPEIVVITGASSGIGRATARLFADDGARLVLAGRDADTLEVVAAECRDRGAEAVTVPTDVSSEADVERLADAAVQRFGGIDTPIHQHAANYTGRPVRPPPPVTDPVRVARAIVRISRRPRRLTQVGCVQSLFVHARALAPAVYEAVVARVYPIIALKRRSVPPDPGNMFRPDRDATGITGGWRILPGCGPARDTGDTAPLLHHETRASLLHHQEGGVNVTDTIAGTRSAAPRPSDS